MARRKVLLVISLFLILIAVSVSNCLAAGVTINRDTYGVPQIYSSTVEGLYYGFGYATAQDRLFQLEMLKRIYYGRVAEVYGKNFAPLDMIARRDYPTKAELTKLYSALDPVYQTLMTAYADGINAWIDQVLKDQDNKLPVEFTQYGFLPEKWTGIDVATPYMVIFGLFMDVSSELTNAEFKNYLVQKYGNEAQKYFDDMVWVNDPGAVVTIQEDAPKVSSAPQNGEQLALLNQAGIAKAAEVYTKDNHITRELLNKIGIAQLPVKVLNDSIKACSYSLAIGPQKSKTGEPIMMGGPQFDFWLPSALNEVGLHGNGFDVVGSTLVGTPFIMFGTNRTVSFGSTAGANNIEDIFEEKLDPNNPGKYFFNGKWVDMQKTTEKIIVRGESTPREIDIYRTVHGAIISQVDTNGDGKNDVAYSKAIGCADEYLKGIEGYYKLMMAESPNQFYDAGSSNPLSINFIYADINGNIGYYHCGKLPIRSEKIDVRFPTPGTGEYEWKGFVAAEDHPFIVNPASGYLVNWNNKPSATFGNGDLSGIFNWPQWGPDQRAKRIMDLVNAQDKLGVSDVENIIHDIADFDLRAGAIKAYLLQALENTQDAQLIEARNYLQNWDNHRLDANKDGLYDAPGYTIFDKWWPNINQNVFGDELGDYTSYLLDSYGGYSLFLRVLQGDKASLPLKEDYLNGKDWKAVFADTLKQTLGQLSEQYSAKPMNEWLSKTKTMSFIPASMLGVPMTLSSVDGVNYMDRGSQNHIILMGKKKIVGENIVAPGTSAFIGKDGKANAHFSDQINLFINWKYKPMYLDRTDLAGRLESTEILNYAVKK